MNLPPLQHEAILASAGCGKTEALSTRYIGLLLRGVPPDRILALTFTRIAAGEITERIMLRLATAMTDAAARTALQDALRVPQVPRDAVAQALAAMLAHLHRLRIGTLDSFFLEIVRAFSLELGLPVRLEIVDACLHQRLQDAALRAIFNAARAGARAFRQFEEIFAQLTFGKEVATVTERLQDAVALGYNLFLDTDAAAWSAVPPVHPPFDRATLAQYLDGLHAHAETKLQEIYQRAKAADWAGILKSGWTKCIADGSLIFNRKPLPPQWIDLLTPLVVHAHAHLLEEARQKTTAFRALLDLYHRAFTEAKRSRGVLSFADIAQLLRHRCVTDPDDAGLYLYYRLDGCIDHLLIDEFQDTSVLQWTDIEPIAAELLATPGERSLFLVGDIKQAIYGWRGGSAALLQKIIGHYNNSQPHIHEQQLVKSYRSGQDILDTVNAVFGGDHADLAPWKIATAFTPHVAAKTMASYAELRGTDAADEQSRYTAVAQLLMQIKPWERGLTAAVLCRKNSVINAVLAVLKQHNIPACSLGRNRIMENPAIQLVISILRLIDLPLDAVARYHVSHADCAAAWQELAHAPLPVLRELRIRLATTSYAAVIKELVAPLRPHVDDATRLLLEQLIELASTYEPWATGRTADFIAFAEQTPVRDAADPAAVVGLTIHGAKGLGFDLVILPDLDASFKTGGSTTHIYTRTVDTPELLDLARVAQVLVAPKSELKLVNADVRAMLDEYDAARKEEFLNTYYVALTRAKRGLYMLIAKPQENSFGKLLAEALPAPAPPPAAELAPVSGTILYAKGDAAWFQEASGHTHVACQKPAPPVVVLNPASTRRRPHRTPSSLERMPVAGRGTWFSAGARRAADTGKLVHAMLSAVAWLDHDTRADLLQRTGPVWEKACMVARAEVPGLAEAEYAAGADRFIRALASNNVQTALAPPATPCAIAGELPFATLVDEAVITGRCDRVVFYPSMEKPTRIDLFDFKTDLLASDADRGRAEARYQPQLMQYQKALAAIYHVPVKKTTAQLLFI